MSKQKTLKLNTSNSGRSKHRYFSESSRQSIVKEIDGGLSKAEAGRKYNVSQTSIQNWYRRYSKNYIPTLKVRVDHQSDSEKNKALESELSKAYESLGRSQAENMLLKKIIELASEHFETDLKKTFEKEHLPTSPRPKKAEK